jgi:hypothetical protein
MQGAQLQGKHGGGWEFLAGSILVFFSILFRGKQNI